MKHGRLQNLSSSKNNATHISGKAEIMRKINGKSSPCNQKFKRFLQVVALKIIGFIFTVCVRRRGFPETGMYIHINHMGRILDLQCCESPLVRRLTEESFDTILVSIISYQYSGTSPFSYICREWAQNIFAATYISIAILFLIALWLCKVILLLDYRQWSEFCVTNGDKVGSKVSIYLGVLQTN